MPGVGRLLHAILAGRLRLRYARAQVGRAASPWLPSPP